MDITYDPPSNRFPDGVWTASTTDRKFDALGNSPLNAVSALVLVLERELR